MLAYFIWFCALKNLLYSTLDDLVCQLPMHGGDMHSLAQSLYLAINYTPFCLKLLHLWMKPNILKPYLL